MKGELYHYGTKRHSGRYPWGSGDVPYQHESWFLNNVAELERQGFSRTEIARSMNMSTTEFRKQYTLEKNAESAALDSRIFELKERGWSNVAIADAIGRDESFVRYRLQPLTQERAQKTNNTVTILKKAVDDSNYIDIGPGTESQLGITETRLKTAVKKLEEEGYVRTSIQVQQPANPNQFTTITVLAKPGTTKAEVWKNRDKIETIEGSYTEDGGKTWRGIEPPASVSSDRIMIRYAEDGGISKDGVIELRRGVEDLSLGNSNYAQVRIAVDGTHYLKGMAIYSDDMPKGVDIIFNTNKTKDVEKMEVFKKMQRTKDGEIDQENPFKSTIKTENGKIVGQSHYIDKDGNERLSAINIVREEGDWSTWSKTLSSQFLAKQPKELIQKQLKLSYLEKTDEFNEIVKLTNPEIKRKLLYSFADDCDASASHLKAVALPRQSSKVILPLTEIKENEVYAPTYRDGEEVILVRYPHGGTFEIPRLIVNNHIPQGDKVIGKNAIDAIGINEKVAQRLSGADFDGDTVTIIPTHGQKISTSSPLDGLMDFEPKIQYKGYEGMKKMTKTQLEMGRISNLITDMTLKGADSSELARAVRHSMVVIDAEKHGLNYIQSELDNGIAELKKKYQGGANKGASTLISLANKEKEVDYRIEKTPDKNTGERSYIYKTKTRSIPVKDPETGEVVDWNKRPVKLSSTYMRETPDAYILSSGTVKERYYADYANKLKALANQARKEAVNTPNIIYSPAAKETYKDEVASLNSKLNIALKNKPLERKATALANVQIISQIKDNPDIDEDGRKKLRTQILGEARRRVGANKIDSQVQITPKEWEAIQAGAITSSKLRKILDNTDSDKIKEYATPRDSKTISKATVARIKAMLDSGNYTILEIADATGVSTSTISKYDKGAIDE